MRIDSALQELAIHYIYMYIITKRTFEDRRRSERAGHTASVLPPTVEGTTVEGPPTVEECAPQILKSQCPSVLAMGESLSRTFENRGLAPTVEGCALFLSWRGA